MIERLFEIEEREKNKVGFYNVSKHKAIRSLKRLMLRIDVQSEWIPIKNKGQIVSLLESLKGERLDKAELELVEEMMLGRELIS